jgi:hypothetical protein
MFSTCKPPLKVLDRWQGREIASVRTNSQGWAIHTLVRSGVSLRNADLKGFSLNNIFLRGADLRGADLTRALLTRAYLRDGLLRGSDMRYADLRQASLRDADLRNANLAHADLTGSDLRGAKLTGAELRSACFENAQLDGAILDWRRGTIPAEILRRSAGAPGGRPRLVLDLLIHGEREDLPWLAVLGRHPDDVAWAVNLLTPYVQPGDNAPPFLKRIVAALRRQATCKAGLTWTRRASARSL